MTVQTHRKKPLHFNTLKFAVRSFNKGFAEHIMPNSVAIGHSINLPVALWHENAF